MKRCLVLSTVCALAAPLLLAAPAPTQAIPGTDLLFVADRLDADIPNQARWDAIEEKYADLFDANLDDVPDDLLPLLKAAFGMTPDGEIKDVKSWTVSVTLPKTLEAFAQLDQDKWPDRLGLYCFIENPRVDLTGVNAAIEKLVTGRPGSGSQLTHKGRWTALTPLDPLEAAGMPLIAWCPIDRGFAVTLCKDYDSAEQAVGNRVAPAPKTPLAEAFKAPSAQGPWGRIVVRDVADLLDRYVTDPMERQEIMEIMPFILQMHGVVASLFYREDGTLQLAITTTTNSAAEALQAHDMLITLKVMIRQGIVPQFYGTPYADLFAGIIDSARCEAEGNAATLTLSLTPDQAEALLDFAAAIQAAPPAEDDEIPFEVYE